MNDIVVTDEFDIYNRIYSIRNMQVMIDRDLAELYGVESKRLNEQVKRNIDRFPEKFRFQLTEIEKNELVANCDRLNTLKYSTSLPYAFTEQGVSMLSAVLRSKAAIEVSIKIIDTFVSMRKFLLNNASIFQKLESIEKKQISYEIKTDSKIDYILNAIENKSVKSSEGIFYDGQIFDAYIFVNDLVKSAKASIVLIDNYVDESVLTLLSKRDNNCTAIIYTKNITKQLQLDVKKYNAQYPEIEIKKFNLSHDRFLIIDNKEVYHIGASLKDLGKKWFAFSKMDIESFEIMRRIK